MVELISIILASLILYYMSLAYKTHVSFRRKNIKTNLLVILYIPYFIFKSNITFGRSNNILKKVFLTTFLEYELFVVIIREIVLFHSEKAVKVEERNMLLGIDKSQLRNESTMKEYSGVAKDTVLAC